MVTPENTMSLAGQHALQDMVELQMYLVAQSQNKPWFMVPRRPNKQQEDRKPYSNPVESSAVMELLKSASIPSAPPEAFDPAHTSVPASEPSCTVRQSGRCVFGSPSGD